MVVCILALAPRLLFISLALALSRFLTRASFFVAFRFRPRLHSSIICLLLSPTFTFARALVLSLIHELALVCPSSYSLSSLPPSLSIFAHSAYSPCFHVYFRLLLLSISTSISLALSPSLRCLPLPVLAIRLLSLLKSIMNIKRSHQVPQPCHTTHHRTHRSARTSRKSTAARRSCAGSTTTGAVSRTRRSISTWT
jgi:hypothetical protein